MPRRYTLRCSLSTMQRRGAPTQEQRYFKTTLVTARPVPASFPSSRRTRALRALGPGRRGWKRFFLEEANKKFFFCNFSSGGERPLALWKFGRHSGGGRFVDFVEQISGTVYPSSVNFFASVLFLDQLLEVSNFNGWNKAHFRNCRSHPTLVSFSCVNYYM